MLVLSRKEREEIIINGDIRVAVVEIRGDKVRIGVEAPKEVPVWRKELFDAMEAFSTTQGDIQMQTVVGLDGKPLTTANKSDMKALSMAKHVEVNCPDVKEAASKAVAGLAAIVGMLDGKVHEGNGAATANGEGSRATQPEPQSHVAAAGAAK